MKNLLRYSVLSFLIISVIGMTGCENDKNQSEEFLLLTSHIWNFDTLYHTSTDPEVLEYHETIMEGMTDGNATMNYFTDGTWKFIIDDWVENGTWVLSEDGTKLTSYEGDDDPGLTYSISELTSDVLVLIETVIDPDYPTFDITVRWVK